jgi:hypothetical protein
VVAFFVPGVTDPARAAEESYDEMRRAVELDLGRRPNNRRISELWTRRGHTDCFTAVGRPDPIHGGTVIAIFDMGPHQPFVVYRQSGTDAVDREYEVLGCNAYSVSEFDV